MEERCLNAPRQITLQQAFAGAKSVPEQIKCWTKAVILGKNIPLQIQGNLGIREMNKLYNNGKMPTTE